MTRAHLVVSPIVIVERFIGNEGLKWFAPGQLVHDGSIGSGNFSDGGPEGEFLGQFPESRLHGHRKTVR